MKGPYGFPQAAATPTDSQLLLVATREGMVTPIAQMWKLRPRQVRVSTLGQVLHPQDLLGSGLLLPEPSILLDFTGAAGRTD